MISEKILPSDHKSLPHAPGVYKFFGEENTIIYVGKAKDLNNRVSNYFSKSSDHNRKTKKLVSEIHSIQIVLVNSESDALLLENSLIKQNQPKYNILLKDDKSFPSIVISNERFPRIYSSRNITPDQGKVFGPYTSVKAMNGVLELIHKIYKIRTCSLNLSQKNIINKKYKVCLEYHIGNCLGPCEGLQEENEYLKDINQAEYILKGKTHVLKNVFTNLMSESANELNFEAALEYKNKLELLNKFQSKSLIVNPSLHNIDVFGILIDDNIIFINYLKIEHGTIRISDTIHSKNLLNHTLEEDIQYLAFSIREKYNSHNTTIFSNISITEWEGVEIIEPKIGDKKKLLDLSIKNALYFKQERERIAYEKNIKSNQILVQLQKDLNLKELPLHIECFDNSNIQGSNPVSSMVCFKNSKPSKKDYRKYNIKTVEGPNDFASMKEVVQRRYKHLLETNQSLPNLIVIDGGKGQLSSAVDSLQELNLYGSIPIIGIAKRLEEIYFPDDSYPVLINKKSQSLKLLQHIRDEAHRFAITFHRSKRSKGANTTILDEIKGIGNKTKTIILSHFKSIKRLREAEISELEELVGQKKAILIQEFFKQKKGT